jgi:hypothetical protein
VETEQIRPILGEPTPEKTENTITVSKGVRIRRKTNY